MKFIDEFRDKEAAGKLSSQIHAVVTRPWTIMEVCGGQTHTIVKYGIDGMLPAPLNLVHGPGCPVCVTPLEIIDKALKEVESVNRDFRRGLLTEQEQNERVIQVWQQNPAMTS